MSRLVYHLLTYLEPVACLIALVAIFRSQAGKAYRTLAALLSLRLAAEVASLLIVSFANAHWCSKQSAYSVYFYLYWASFAAESLLSLYVILEIFRRAMAPLKGLQTLGMLVFRWAAAVSTALAIVSGFAPTHSSAQLIMSVVSHLNEIASVLTLCLLLFVCYAIHPLGLNFRSREFGVSIGLGIAAAGHLLAAAWTFHSRLDSNAGLLAGTASLICVATWASYFLLPEAKRRIIVLPTTSPFLRWNQISEALGDEPGFVAIAGVPPEVFAPAELEIMFRASALMPSAAQPEPVAPPKLAARAHATPLSA